jgi:hypothetical protein
MNYKLQVLQISSERAISLAQGNTLCRKHILAIKPQRGVIRLFRLISPLQALQGLMILCISFVGRCRRCPTLLITLFQSLMIYKIKPVLNIK